MVRPIIKLYQEFFVVISVGNMKTIKQAVFKYTGRILFELSCLSASIELQMKKV